jgi:site-specific recombinase XerD
MVTLSSKVLRGTKAISACPAGGCGDDVVFQSKLRRGMGDRSIEDVVSKYLRDADIWGASVRSLRHTFATHSVKRGTSVKVVQKMLGHDSRKTTSVSSISLGRRWIGSCRRMRYEGSSILVLTILIS